MPRASSPGRRPTSPLPEALAVPLRGLGVRLRLLRLAWALGLWVLTCGLSLAALAALLQALPGPRGLGALPVGSVALALLVAAVALALVHPTTPRHLARLVEHRFPDLRDSLLAAVDPAPGAPLSPLHQALVARVAARLGPERLGSALDRRPATRALAAGAVAALVAVFALTSCPQGLARMLGAPPPAAPEPPARTSARAPAAPPTPALYDLTVTVTPPPYTGLPVRSLTADFDHLQVPTGSVLTLEARQAPGCETSLIMAPQAGGLAPLTAESLRASLTLTAPLQWSLRTSLGRRHVTAGPFRVAVIPDRAPRVSLSRPGRDLSLESVRPVELAVAAADDYGLAEVSLQYRRAGSPSWQSLTLGGGDRTLDARWQWDLTSMGLQPGDVLEYRAVARDNSAATRPAITRTRVYRIRVAPLPGPARLPSQVRAAQAAEASALEALREEAAALRREVQQVAQSGAAEADSPAAREVARAQLRDAGQRLAHGADQVREAMAEADRMLADSPLMSPETMAKVLEVHQLMAQLVDRDMADLMRQIQDTLTRLGQPDSDRRLAATLEAQQRFVDKLDRTLALLRRARREAELDALKRLAADLATRQEELLSTPNETDPAAAKARATPQSRLAAEAGPLPEQISKLAAEAASEPALQTRLNELASELGREDPAARMREAAAALSRGRSREARTPQQKAAQSLRQTADQLAGLQSQAAAEARQGLERELRRLTRESLTLSDAQEALNRGTLQASNAARADQTARQSVLRNLRRRQDSLEAGARTSADGLRRLADATPLVTPELISQADTLAADMASAGRSLSGGEVAEAYARQGAALSGLNTLARDLLDLSRRAGSMTARSELQEHLQRLEDLTRRQQALNSQLGQGTQGAQGESAQGQGDRGSRPGGATPDLAALAQEQAMLRQALQKLMAGSAGSALAGKLGGVPAEMSRSEDEMRGRQVSPQTVERQGAILRKMLEAQRSLYSRPERGRERQAQTAKPYRKPLAPPALHPERPRASSVIPREPVAAPDLPLDYEDITRHYLERIRH